MKSPHHWITYCGPWDDTWVKAIQSDARADLECELREAVELLEWSNVFIPVDYNPEEELTASNDANRARRTKREIKAFLARQKGAQS